MKYARKKLKFLLLIVPVLLYFVLLSAPVNKFVENALLSYAVVSRSSVKNALSEYSTASVTSNELSTTNISKDLIKAEFSGSTSYVVTDPRIIAMRKFLIDYRSPMYPYADVFIIEADKYGLDWRLVASITGVESAFGNMIPYKSNNGWGWRGGPNGNFSNFTTWRQGIEVVTRGLALGYGIKLTPFQIEPTYCPPCGQNPAHSWANGVTKYMNELDYYVKNLESL